MDNITYGKDRLEDYAIHESQNAYTAVLPPRKVGFKGRKYSFSSDSALKTKT
ncbi:MAG: hypothetical protein KKE44_24835 [Proteobacteria bacterium]|nr:hypothetical protein [Pseudomonadota bacterium]MBU2628229.1 hypothetical protein [Pseudomonadota bacterium]